MSRIQQITKMLAAEPDDVFLNFSLAMEYVRAGRDEDALTRFARVTRLDPDYVAAYGQQAHVLIALDRKAEARATLERGIAAARKTGDTHAADDLANKLAVLGTGD